MMVNHGRQGMIDDSTSTMKSEGAMSNDEWENRQLCSDGNCIGVIGPDGLCKECGQPGEGGTVPAVENDDVSDEPLAQDTPDEAAPAREEDAAETAAVDNDDDWTNRRLCPDGNCIGVIGPDGRCKECGRSED